MRWNQVGYHHHPAETTFLTAEGEQETLPADRLPFAIEGDVTVEALGVVVRDGVCVTCSQRVMPSKGGSR